MGQLGLPKAREGGQQTLTLSFSVIDTGQEGLGDLVQRFGAQTAGDEIAESLVSVALAGRDEDSRPMRTLPAGEMSDDRRKGLNLVGTSKKTPSGNGTGLPLEST